MSRIKTFFLKKRDTEWEKEMVFSSGKSVAKNVFSYFKITRNYDMRVIATDK